MFERAIPKMVTRWLAKRPYPSRSRPVRGGPVPASGASGSGPAAGRTARASATDGGGRERLLDQHDGNVRDDRVDETGVGAVEPLLDDRLLIPEVLPVLLDQQPTNLPRQLDDRQLAFGLRADQNLEQLGVNGHRVLP